MSRNMLVLVAAAILLIAVWGIVATRNDWARRDAAFLAQCHEAGYDAAKCQFFLTVMSRANASAAAMQMMIEIPK